MLELRKMNCEDIVEQWKYVTSLPTNENGLTNQYEGVSFEEYRDVVLPELMMHENSVSMPVILDTVLRRIFEVKDMEQRDWL